MKQGKEMNSLLQKFTHSLVGYQEAVASRDPKYIDALSEAYKEATERSDVAVTVTFRTYGELTLAAKTLRDILKVAQKYLKEEIKENDLEIVFELKNDSCIVCKMEQYARCANNTIDHFLNSSNKR